MLGACLVFFILLQQTRGYDGRAHQCTDFVPGVFTNIHATCIAQGTDERINILQAYYQLSNDGCSTAEATLDPCRGGLDVLTQNVSAKCNGRSSCTYYFTFPSAVECDVDNVASGDIVMVFIYFDCVSDDIAATPRMSSTTPANSPDSSTALPSQPPTTTTKPTEPTTTRTKSTQSANTDSASLPNQPDPTQPPPISSEDPVTGTEQAASVWPIPTGICIFLLALCVAITVVVKLRRRKPAKKAQDLVLETSPAYGVVN